MRCPEVICQEFNKSRLTDHFIKYRGREKERPFTIDFNNFPNDYYILGGRLYQNGEKHPPFHIMFSVSAPCPRHLDEYVLRGGSLQT